MNILRGNKWKKAFMGLAAGVLLLQSTLYAADESRPLKIRFINFKTCVEQSKVGKKEASSFEALKKQMESSLEEKEKTLNDIATKFDDPDYLDSLSPEAETELKRKFRALSQELTQLQNQYYQALQQTNFKVIQKLTDSVNEAAKKLAKDENIDVIFNEESSFYYNPNIDISSKVIGILDTSFEAEGKEAKPTN